jgi:hypothetical protein
VLKAVIINVVLLASSESVVELAEGVYRGQQKIRGSNFWVFLILMNFLLIIQMKFLVMWRH